MLARRTVFSLLFFCCLFAGLEVYGHEFYPFTGGDVHDDEVGGHIEQGVSAVLLAVNENIIQPCLVKYNNPGGSSSMWGGSDIGEWEDESFHSNILIDTETNEYTGPGYWSAPLYHPQNGDRIIEVNGTTIRNTDDFREVIRNSESEVVIALIDRRSGDPYFMKTTLLPRVSRSRLGIDVRDDEEYGAVVTGVMANMPGDRCRYFNDGGVQPVRDQSNVIGGRENRPFHTNILIDTETNEYTGPGYWSAPLYHPENGDRIIEVNGMIIRNTDDFREVIRNSESEVVIALIGRRSGDPYFMKTTLLPRGSRSRLGITVRDDEEYGAMVTGVMANMPGDRCRYYNDGNVQPVRGW